MKTKVYANLEWQHIGTVTEAGNLYADGEWCFNTKERAARTCNSIGRGRSGNYYIIKINKGDNRYPYTGDNAVVGQLLVRVGEQGMPVPLDEVGRLHVEAGWDLWLRINDDFGVSDNDGELSLRIVTPKMAEYDPARTNATNSYGDPIGTQYKRNAAGGYVKII
ncbi:hypothetical protein [Pseudomonas sp. Z3-8]|uniref:hypothetical protein n=1 Tax=Pseudomonas sp. Z3-8 TaxID=2817412 RepID=UPI003DA8D6F9